MSAEREPMMIPSGRALTRRPALIAILAALILATLVWLVGGNGVSAQSSSAERAVLAPVPAAPAVGDARELFEVAVTVTGYSSTADQTDATPFITAANTRVRTGIVALSRDLLREYTPGAPFQFGDRVLIRGIGEFRVEDTMNRRYRKRVDIWFATRGEARNWGRQHHHTLVKLVEEDGDHPAVDTPSRFARFETALAD